MDGEIANGNTENSNTVRGSGKANTRVTNTRTGSAGGRTTGNTGSVGATGSTGTEKANDAGKAPKLVVIDTPDQITEADKKEQRRIKDRERYAKSKAEKSTGKSSGSGSAEVLDSNQLAIILMTVSALVASRPNMEHWLFTETEVKQITAPLSNILAKSEALSNAGQYADAISLVIACSTVVIPKVMISVAKTKQREGMKNVTAITDTANKNGESKVANSKADGKRTADVPSNNSNVAQLLPSVG